MIRWGRWLIGRPLRWYVRARGEAITDMAAGFGYDTVLLVGSVARGRARRASDIDLFVASTRGTSILHATLGAGLSDLLGRRVHVIDAHDVAVTPDPAMNTKLLADAIPLHATATAEQAR